MISFTVFGKAEPAGSKSRGRYGGMFDSNPKAHEWQRQVAQAAAETMEMMKGPFLEGPLCMTVFVVRPRPKGHYGTGRNAARLKDSAPDYPTTKPDLTKLLRGIEDALTGIVWRDDAQVVVQSAQKVYGEPARAEVQVCTIRELLEDTIIAAGEIQHPHLTLVEP